MGPRPPAQPSLPALRLSSVWAGLGACLVSGGLEKQVLCGPTALLAESVNPLPEATGQKCSHCEGKDNPMVEVPPQGVEYTQETYIGTHTQVLPCARCSKEQGLRKEWDTALALKELPVLGKGVAYLPAS